MNNCIWGNDTFQSYETILGGTGAGPGFDGTSAVQCHTANTRMTDPEVPEKRFRVRLEEFRIRRGSGGGEAVTGRRLRFLAPVTVTTLSLSRIVPPPSASTVALPGRSARTSPNGRAAGVRPWAAMPRSNCRRAACSKLAPPAAVGAGRGKTRAIADAAWADLCTPLRDCVCQRIKKNRSRRGSRQPCRSVDGASKARPETIRFPWNSVTTDHRRDPGIPGSRNTGIPEKQDQTTPRFHVLQRCH